MCFPSVGRSATLQSIVRAFVMLAENYIDLHTELGNHPSRSLLLNSLISFCVWDLFSISSGWKGRVVTEALLNSISTFPLWIEPTRGAKLCEKQTKKWMLALLKVQFWLHSQIHLCFSFILKHLPVFLYVVFVLVGLPIMSAENRS